jgi:hypothetical protein
MKLSPSVRNVLGLTLDQRRLYPSALLEVEILIPEGIGLNLDPKIGRSGMTVKSCLNSG